jgi:energy-coupling factor transporter ATP-binding protein EcfA2
MSTAPATAAPLLRTLSPALKGLERGLRAWIDGTHREPLTTIGRATLEGLDADLHRQAEALDVDRPLLVIVLMGGTGVGKSTLLNALAGGTIAKASFTRPTTRDPVVYYHESIKPDRLPAELRHCRLAPHDRPPLEHKIIVDTPDLDSNEPANRERLKHVLPVADIVLYVGSQEKYHDQIGWQLFLEQRRRRAFAFVLNKWDRCLHTGATGVRPDEDLLRDLAAQGFEKPLLFRTCARLWLDKGDRLPVESEKNGEASSEAASGGGVATIPEGEQFRELQHWLEAGLTRLEIEAIKARGVGQLLAQLRQGLADSCPPDLTEVAGRVRAAWTRPIAEESTATTDILLDSLDPYQREIEHHFAIQGQSRFHGLMAAYLHLFTRIRYVGSTLKNRIPLVGRSKAETTPSWDLTMLTRACSDVAANRQLDARGRALANRLLLTASDQGFPLTSLADPVEAVGKIDWRQSHSRALNEVLQRVEKQWTKPTGTGRIVQSGLVLVADILPPLSLLAGFLILLWRFYDPYGTTNGPMHLSDVLLPFVALISVLVILHLLIVLLMPLRWSAIRSEFGRQLSARVQEDLEAAYGPAPTDVAEALRLERRQVEKLSGEVEEVATWLSEREQSATGIEGLYGAT